MYEVMKKHIDVVNEQIKEYEDVIESIKKMIQEQGRYVLNERDEQVDLQENLRWRTQKLEEMRALRERILSN